LCACDRVRRRGRGCEDCVSLPTSVKAKSEAKASPKGRWATPRGTGGPRAGSVLPGRQGGGHDQPGGGVLDEHDLLIGDVPLFEDPAELAKEVLRLIDLRRVEQHYRMAVHARAWRSVRQPGAVKGWGALGRSLGIAGEAGVKKLRQQFSLFV